MHRIFPNEDWLSHDLKIAMNHTQQMALLSLDTRMDAVLRVENYRFFVYFLYSDK